MSVVWLVDADGVTPARLPDPPAVVLLHFDTPLAHAGHVAVILRPGERRRGRVWRMLQAAQRGGLVRVARVWPCADVGEAERTLETVRKAGGRARYCPVCRAVPAAGVAGAGSGTDGDQ